MLFNPEASKQVIEIKTVTKHIINFKLFQLSVETSTEGRVEKKNVPY